MKKIILSLLIFFSGLAISQEKKNFEHTYTLFNEIKPNDKFDYWAVYFFDGDNFHQLKQYGGKRNVEKEETGFLKSTTDNSYYYIVSEKSGKKAIVNDDLGLKKFIGKIDNVQEATLIMLLKGFFIDEEYQSIAGNYFEDKENYHINLAQVSSENCPYAKQSVELIVDKSTGLLMDTKEGKVYFEKFRKECKNNPHQEYRLKLKK